MTHTQCTRPQIEGGDINRPPDHYYSLGVVTPATYKPFRLDAGTLERFTEASLHRPRNPSIFEGPLLLCPKGNFVSAVESGRYSATVSSGSALYNKNFYGISFYGKEPEAPRVLNAILNSSLTTFQLAFGGSTWGLERPTIEPNDLLSLRVPDLATVDPDLLKTVLDAEQAVAEEPDNSQRLNTLDQAIYRLYGLDHNEAVIASESVGRARMLLFEGRMQRMAFVKPPTPDALSAYAVEVVQAVNAYLRARGKRHLEAVVYPRRVVQGNLADGTPGITAVRFAMVSGAPMDVPIVRQGGDTEIEWLATLLRGQVNADIPPYLNERRQLRIYKENDLIILKPSESRYWTRTAGLNDADVILMDHWIKVRHALRA